eukprot:scaffold16256_cov80-Cylindrotheca_fusiformis.AAC.1
MYGNIGGSCAGCSNKNPNNDIKQQRQQQKHSIHPINWLNFKRTSCQKRNAVTMPNSDSENDDSASQESGASGSSSLQEGRGKKRHVGSKTNQHQV